MSIVLNWKQQPGQTLDSIEIYRYVNPRQSVNPNSPGSPLVVLPGNATTYEDTTTAPWTTYQYRIVSVKGNDKVMGMPIVQGDFPYTGPGPQELIRGDWWRGYFGTLSNTEFILNAAELNGLIGFTAWNQNVTLFHKFVFKGRILFIPDSGTKVSTTWREQYNQGLMWGTDDTGQRIPNNVTGVNQRKTFNKNGFEYVLRLPRMVDYTQNADNTNYYGSPASYAQEGEWWNTIDSIYRYNGWVRRFDHVERPASGSGTNVQGVTLFANGYSNLYGMVFLAASPMSPTYVNMDTACFVQHVIELVLN
ncbi:putative virion structural protein [Salmonella phage SPAsTU]|nr:putative virion structural protein 19 [Salmonella phage STsAS]AWN09176.1 putative virion structural protein [Salmonella phage SPAsTU]